MTTTRRVDTIEPIPRTDVERIAATEYARFVEQLRSLDPDDWHRPTDCPLWDVRAMAGHTIGMMTDFTSLRRVLRRVAAATRAARRNGGEMLDSMTAMQVADYADMANDDLITHAERTGPRAAHWRATAPGLLRRMPVRQMVGGEPERWTIGFLLDTILTRDAWMHRADIARATGRPMTLTPEHDGRIVADIVAEWARRHGRPFTLTLTGPAGGRFTGGEPGRGEDIEVDAVEFCRMLSGRVEGVGLLAQPVPF